MTLILTELSKAGIAMASDSAISKVQNGKIVPKVMTWKKLLPVPRIKAGVSYWGHIGLITRYRFDEWLEKKIQRGSYDDLPTFADYLAEELNRAVNYKPIDQQVGIHVAGYQKWKDGELRPSFYHVHNGNGHVEYDKVTISGATKLMPRWTTSPKQELFKRHDDYSPETKKPDELDRGIYITMNGDFSTFGIIFEQIRILLEKLDTLQDFTFPRDKIGPHLGLLKAMIDFTIDLYKFGSMPNFIGGPITTLGINPNGRYVQN